MTNTENLVMIKKEILDWRLRDDWNLWLDWLAKIMDIGGML
jgi:hypothetical protein